MSLTLEPIAVPMPAARTLAPPAEAVPYPELMPTEAADLFAVYHIRPNPRRYLVEDLPVPCGCLVSVFLVHAVGSIAAARAAIEDARYIGYDGCNRLALVQATGWGMPFVAGLDLGFTRGSVDYALASCCWGMRDDPNFRRGAALGAAVRRVIHDRGALP